MPGWIDWVSPQTVLACGRGMVVDVLRSAAGALHALADAVDVPVAPAPTPDDDAEVGDGPPPGTGTRERIGEALQRARSRYDAVSERPAPPTARPERLPREPAQRRPSDRRRV